MNSRPASGHRAAQAKGWASVLANYRLRVADLLGDCGLNEREQVPADSLAFDAAHTLKMERP